MCFQILIAMLFFRQGTLHLIRKNHLHLAWGWVEYWTMRSHHMNIAIWCGAPKRYKLVGWNKPSNYSYKMLFAYHKPYWRYVHQLRTFAHLCHGTGPDHGWQRAACCFWSEKKSDVIGTNWGFRPSQASSAFPRDMLAPLCRFVISHALCALCAALLPFHFSQVSRHCAWATAAVCEIFGDA